MSGGGGGSSGLTDGAWLGQVGGGGHHGVSYAELFNSKSIVTKKQKSQKNLRKQSHYGGFP